MNTTFLLTPPIRLHQALLSELEGGGTSFDPLTRRRFLKRTGGTTVSALIAWNLATNRVAATEDGDASDENGSSGSDSPPPPGPNKAITKTTEVASPTPDYSLPGSIVVAGSSQWAQNVPIQWEFSYKVKVGGEAQQESVATDCASCEVYEVQLKLIYTGAALRIPGTGNQTYNNLPTIAGPTVKRGYDITNNGSCPDNPLANLGNIEGQLDKNSNNITIAIAGAVTPNDPGAVKTIKWTVTATNNINIATLKGQMETAIDALYSNAHTVTVNLPNIAMSGDERYQTVTAVCTSNEVDDGAGCTIP